MGEKLVSEIVGRSAVRFSMFILFAVLLSLLSVSYASANIMFNVSDLTPANNTYLNYNSNINVTFSVYGNYSHFNCSVALIRAGTTSFVLAGNETIVINSTLARINFTLAADSIVNWTVNCSGWNASAGLGYIDANNTALNMTFTTDTIAPTIVINFTGVAADLFWNGSANQSNLVSVINTSNTNIMFNYTITDNTTVTKAVLMVDHAAGYALLKNFTLPDWNTSATKVNISMSGVDQNLTGDRSGNLPFLIGGPTGSLAGAAYGGWPWTGAHNFTFFINDSAGNKVYKSYAVFLVGVNVTQMEQALPYMLTGGAAAAGIIDLKVYIVAADGGFARANGTMNPTSNQYVWAFNKSAGDTASAIEFMIWNFTLSNANMSNMKNMSSNHSQPDVPPPGGSMNNNTYAMVNMLGFLEDSMYEHGIINISMAQRYYYINFSTKSPNMVAPIYTVMGPCNVTVNPKNASLAIPANKGCWINDTQGRALLFLDHFSGVGGVNDTTPPNITMNAPTRNGTWTNDNTTRINFTIVDLGESGDFGINDTSIVVTILANISAGGTFNISIYPFNASSAINNITCASANATAVNNMSRTCWFDTNMSVDGNYTVNITVKDWMGNVQNHTFFYYVDTNAPTIMYQTESMYSYSNFTAVPGLGFNFTANDTMDSTLNCSLYFNFTLNTTTNTSNATQANLTVTMIDEGFYTWYINCSDNASNRVTSRVANFTIDTKVPVVTITAPLNNSFTNSSTVTISWVVVDQGNRADKVRYYSVTQGAGSPSNNSNASGGFPVSSYSVSFTSLVEGLNNITVTANDTFGNQGYNYTNITLDTTAPIITSNVTQASRNVGDVINFSIGFDEINPENITLFLNGALFNVTRLYANATRLRLGNITINYTFTTNATWNGTNTIWARLCDAVGYCVNSGNFTVQINDTGAPSVTFGYPAYPDGNATNNATVVMNFSIYDSGGINLSTINMTLDNLSVYNYTTDTSLAGAGGIYCSGSTGGTVTSCNVTTRSLTAAKNYSINMSVKDLGANQNITKGWNTTWIYIDTANPDNVSFVLDNQTYGYVLINSTNCTDSVRNSTRQDVYRGTSASALTLLKSFAETVTESFYNDSSVTNGSFYYKIRCFDDAGNYNDSAVQNVTVVDYVKPAQITSLNVSGSTDTATLTWSVVKVDINNSNDTAGLRYKIYRGTTATCSDATNTTCWLNVANITSATTNSTTNAVTETGTYYYVVTAIDDAGNENTTIRAGNNVTITLNYTAPTTTTTATTTSGGSPATTTPTTSTVSSQSFIFSILSGATKTVSVTTEALALTNVQLAVTANADNVNLKFEKIAEQPAAVGAPSGTVYQNLQITKTNLPDTSIGSVKIQFRVEKTWLTEKGAKDSDIVMTRYTDKWNELTTKKTTESDKYIYYEATSPGFSYFAVVAKKAAAPVTPPTTATVTPTPTPTPTPEVTPTPTPTPAAPEAAEEAAPSNAWIVWVIVIVIVIAVIIGVVMMGKKKK